MYSMPRACLAEGKWQSACDGCAPDAHESWVLLYDGQCDRAVIDRVRQTVSLAGRCLRLSSISSLFFQQIATMLRSSSDLGADQGS